MMDIEAAKQKKIDAFIRRFHKSKDEIVFVDPETGYLRVKNTVTNDWVDYEISTSRIRAVARNNSDEQQGDP